MRGWPVLHHEYVRGADGTGGGMVVGFGLLVGLFVATALISHASHPSAFKGDMGVAETVESPACPTGSPQSGDLDADGRIDVVTVEPIGEYEWLVHVRRAAGGVAEVRVSSECATLLGLADVNGDGREEIWFKDGIGNTAHTFNLIAWNGDSLRVIVGGDRENPLYVGWGSSGGASLWCGDATGDGRPEIIRTEFRRSSEGSIEDPRETVYELRDDELLEVSEGPPHAAPPDSALSCGPVMWS